MDSSTINMAFSGFSREIREGKEFAAKEKLEIVASLSEAQTAKEPGKNVGSNLMLNVKRLEISPKNGWRARVAGEPMTAFPNWRCLVDYVGTYYQKLLEQMYINSQAKPALAYTR